MVFYLAGLQNIDYSVYEASYIDGATPFQQFTKITIPLLKPTILADCHYVNLRYATAVR